MHDLKAHRLPFQGFALSPLTDAGRDFLTEFEWEDSTFRHPDACMTGLPDDAVGYEPFLMDEVVGQIQERGLTIEKGR